MVAGMRVQMSCERLACLCMSFKEVPVEIFLNG